MSPLAATPALGLPLGALFWESGAVSLPLALGVMMLFVFVVLSSGFLLLRAVRASDLPAPAAWVSGIFATALVVYALVAAFGILAVTAFGIWATVIALWSVYVARTAPAARRLEASELVSLLLCVAAAAFWCGELAEVPGGLAREGVLKTWVDQFIHGSVISQFGDPRAAGAGEMELARTGVVPYHYASYMLPAVFAGALDLPGLTLATSIWVPVGFVTACAGAYALGAAIGGHYGGVAALVALTLLPDPASYGLHNHLFGYYWYTIAVPGACYGIGIALLATAFAKRWALTGEPRALIAGACLVIGLAFVRVHLFALAFPAWLVCTALCTRAVQARKLLFLGGALGLFGIFVGVFYRVFTDAAPALDIFLHVTHNLQVPLPYSGLYMRLMHFHGPAVAVPAGLGLVFAAFLGVFIVLYPLSVVVMRRVRRLDVVDAAPVVFLGCYLLLMLTGPIPPHGDATEFTQRPFVLAYAVVAVWTGAGLAAWFAARGSLRDRRVWLPLVVSACLAVLCMLRYTVSDLRWNYRYKPAEGLLQAAAFVRARAHPGEVFAAQGLSPYLVYTDLPVQFVSLTGVPTYLARPWIHVAYGGPRAEIAIQRYSALRGIEREQSAEAALGRLRSLGIRWYVVAETDSRGPRWDPQRRHAVFVDRMVAVYSTGAER